MTTDTRPPTTDPKFWGETFAYPDLRRRSILEPLPLGVRATDREQATACFRHSSAYVWGQHGSGRSVALLDITAGLVQCTDTLVWSIGTDISRLLLRPFGAGAVTAPCIDWVAPTLDEAHTMARTALAIALNRKRVYAELKYQHNTNVMPVGDGAPGNPPPAIVIVVGADAPPRRNPDTRDLYDLLRMIDDRGGDSAVRVVYSGFRPTVDYMPATSPQIQIGMRPTDAGDLIHGFGYQQLEPIQHIGGGYLRSAGFDAPEPFKAFYMSPVRLSEIGEQTAPWRPRLDEASLAADVEAYASRWRRTAPHLWVSPAAYAMQYQGC